MRLAHLTLAMFALGALSACAHAAPKVEASDLAVVEHLVLAGFNCSARDGGTECVGRTDAYPEPVAVLVPSGLRFGGRYLVHLHGFVLGTTHDSSFGAILRDFEFLRLLKRAGVSDSILVVPSSRGHCDTYLGFFTKHDSFTLWLDSIAHATGLAAPTQIGLSGHSGAYETIELVLEQARAGASAGLAARVRDLILLDATYSDLKVDHYTGWLRASATRRLRAAFRPGTSTEIGARRLWSGVSNGAFSTAHANSAGRTEILPGSGQGDAADHWGMVRAYYPRFIQPASQR